VSFCEMRRQRTQNAGILYELSALECNDDDKEPESFVQIPPVLDHLLFIMLV
jgi:hypothetical protein